MDKAKDKAKYKEMFEEFLAAYVDQVAQYEMRCNYEEWEPGNLQKWLNSRDKKKAMKYEATYIFDEWFHEAKPGDGWESCLEDEVSRWDG